MTQKTYTAKTCISVNVALSEYISATVIFEPQRDGSSKFITTDEDIQTALEAHSSYGKLFVLDDTETVTDPITEPKVTRHNKEEYAALSEETNARKQADAQIVAQSVSAVEYDGTTNYVKFYNADGEVIAYIDATPFVVDGMVSSVEVTGGNLVITFNTDAGKQPISIPLTDIFNPANYYTKTEVDNAMAAETAYQKNFATIMALATDPNAGVTISTTNPEWQLALTDNEDRLLIGKRHDNTWYTAPDLDAVLTAIIDGYTTT